MCVSRLHQVIREESSERVTVLDLDGRYHVVSLLALDGPPPHVGDWLVVHSGYALERVSSYEAESIRGEIERGRRADEPRTKPAQEES